MGGVKKGRMRQLEELVKRGQAAQEAVDELGAGPKRKGFSFTFSWSAEAIERWEKDGRWVEVDKLLAQLLALSKVSEMMADDSGVSHEIRVSEDFHRRGPTSGPRMGV